MVAKKLRQSNMVTAVEKIVGRSLKLVVAVKKLTASVEREVEAWSKSRSKWKLGQN